MGHSSIFYAFSIQLIDISKNVMTSFLANIALKTSDITLVRIYKVEVKNKTLCASQDL